MVADGTPSAGRVLKKHGTKRSGSADGEGGGTRAYLNQSRREKKNGHLLPGEEGGGSASNARAAA